MCKKWILSYLGIIHNSSLTFYSKKSYKGNNCLGFIEKVGFFKHNKWELNYLHTTLPEIMLIRTL